MPRFGVNIVHVRSGCSAGPDAGLLQNVTAETDQYEDHTFSGIMFDIKTNKLPLEYIEVSSIWVRGDLGRSRTGPRALLCAVVTSVLAYLLV